MRTARAMADWEIFMRACWGRRRPGLDLWSRFAVELAPALIVSPHLFDWPASAPKDGDVYTCAATPSFALFCGRGAHRTYLEEEVVPRVVEAGVPVVVLLDADAELAHVRGIHRGCARLRDLGSILDAWLGDDAIFGSETSSLDPATIRYPFDTGRRDPSPEIIERAEQHPLRLWEALFWRGATYRYECVGGELPLGADAAPTLLGALTAGGENGKTEMIDGYTWSTCILRDAAEARALATQLASQAAAWTGAPSRVAELREARQRVRGGDEWIFEPHDRFLTIWVPVHRAGCWPMDVIVGEPVFRIRAAQPRQ